MTHTHIHHDLIESCREGKRRGQLELYELYNKAMFNLALQFLSDRQEAEEVMQEAFLNAFMNISGLTENNAFGSWLKRIVIRKCLDELKRKKISWVEQNSLEDIPDDNSLEATPAFSINAIKKHIEALPTGYKVVLTLYLIEGYDHEEIAQILGITASASRSQMARAKEKLRRSLNTRISYGT